MTLSVDIEKKFGSFELQLSFTAAEGVTGILGASGCGKSLSLKCIAGLITPDRGRITLNGRTLFDSARGINLPPQRRAVGYLFQQYALFPHMTVRENIAAGLHHLNHREKQAETLRLLKLFQLEELSELRPAQLSGGQQQRTALARILASRPEALLLDEPFSALDSYLKQQVELTLFQQLRDFSGPILLVSHSQQEIRRQCSHVCVLHKGHAQPMQTTAELFSAPETLSACRLSGCENLSPVHLLPGQRAESALWGAVLSLPHSCPPDVCYVGIRAGALRLCTAPGVNRIPCTPLTPPFSDGEATELLLSTPGGSAPEQLLRLRCTKELPALSGPLYVELPPDALQLLRADI